ncbi:MAG: response regulator [Chloroflexi bacterium]|nr:response regulator [Chloroflexota bacterium]
MNSLRVFIVDDNIDFAESLALLLEGRGCEVELALSGEEAIEKFHQHDFDITFMDIKLPGKNGVESFMEIRKLNPSARVVMMTGYSVEQLLEQAVEQGAWRILNKPIDVHRVLDMLEEIKPDGILVVDDDPDFIESVKILLENKGYTVFVAGNGQDAIERIYSQRIDILILDLRMPILNGLETYLELKQNHHVIPTIIVTAYADEESDVIAKLRSMSVSAILRKPFDPRELLNMLKHLSHQTAREE